MHSDAFVSLDQTLAALHIATPLHDWSYPSTHLKEAPSPPYEEYSDPPPPLPLPSLSATEYTPNMKSELTPKSYPKSSITSTAWNWELTAERTVGS